MLKLDIFLHGETATKKKVLIVLFFLFHSHFGKLMLVNSCFNPNV